MSSGQYRCSSEVRAGILDLARRQGACSAGFAEASVVADSEMARYEAWLAAGRNGGMDYLGRYGDVRRDPALLLPGAESVLCVAFAYAFGRRHPLFADYALGEDYHNVLRRRLEPVAEAMRDAVAGSETRVCVDTAPVRERYWAVKAGLGFIGLNNLLIVPGAGSKVFLAEIFWTAGVEPSAPCSRTVCEGCGACVRACPGGALDGCGGLDARRCLSYLTIEHRGELPATLDLRHRRIYGCDVCQDVCPHNKLPNAGTIEEFVPSERLMELGLDDVATMTPSAFRSLFRNSAVRRARLEGLRRNALHAK